MIPTKHRIAEGKFAYQHADHSQGPCEFCAPARQEPTLDVQIIHRQPGWFVMLNLYPFNPGHVMIVPVRHVQDVRELTDAEVLEQHRLLTRTLGILGETHRPGGFNVGYNLGPSSGASIAHLHLHVVPRHRSELGFFDVLTDSRAIGEDPRLTHARLTAAFAAPPSPQER